MRFEYAAAAVDEVDEALRYYELIDPALGKRLLLEIEDALNLIQRFPTGWRPLGEGLRQRRLKTFPFAFIYAIQDDVIGILAFANSHRRPGYWRDRTQLS